MTDIGAATADYERWLAKRTSVVAAALRAKHSKMREDLFAFFRGTFYRWVQLWSIYGSQEARTPRVLAIGDLHVDSFGTWRDAEGRLCWGVDDFDDAYPLPYSNDLIRLAASVRIASDAGLLGVKERQGTRALLEGYRSTLRSGGCPFVLAESHQHMEKLGIREIEPPRHFWRKLSALPAAHGRVPPAACRALVGSLPDPVRSYTIVRRRAGMGSLGQPRYAMLAYCDGGFVAREAKAVVPSACAWAAGSSKDAPVYYMRIMERAVRSPDPYQRVNGKWLIRRLSPDSNPIEIESLDGKRDDLQLLHAMGVETANVHLGSPRSGRAIVRDLRRRPSGWLTSAGKTMATVVEQEWKEYRKGR